MGKKNKKNQKKMKKIIYAIKVGLVELLAVIEVIVGVYATVHALNNESRNEEKAEMESHPCFEASWGEKVSMGKENYYKIYLKNSNENVDIMNGRFSFQYIVLMEMEDGANTNFFWNEVIKEPGLVYDKQLGGGILLIREDFYTCEEHVRELCSKSKLQGTVCHSAILFCFRYVCKGRNEEVYYKLELKEDSIEGAVEIVDLDRYKEGVQMDLITH